MSCQKMQEADLNCHGLSGALMGAARLARNITTSFISLTMMELGMPGLCPALKSVFMLTA